MDIVTLRAIVDDCAYDRGTAVGIDSGADMQGLWVEIVHERKDQLTGLYGWGRGGKRRIHHTANRSQVVRTIFGALTSLEEHEAREAFRYKGAQVYGPHIDVDALVEVADRVDYAMAGGDR